MPSLLIFVYWNRKVKDFHVLTMRKSKKTLGWTIKNRENKYIPRVSRNPLETMDLEPCETIKEAELLIEEFYGVKVA